MVSALHMGRLDQAITSWFISTHAAQDWKLQEALRPSPNPNLLGIIASILRSDRVHCADMPLPWNWPVKMGCRGFVASSTNRLLKKVGLNEGPSEILLLAVAVIRCLLVTEWAGSKTTQLFMSLLKQSWHYISVQLFTLYLISSIYWKIWSSPSEWKPFIFMFSLYSEVLESLSVPLEDSVELCH